jgi:probable F420-dependent oxidoreductase
MSRTGRVEERQPPRLRVSIQIPTAPNLPAWVDKARRAESLGFSSISVPDHLGRSLPQLAPLVALAAAAPATTSLRLATTVLNNDFRHPVMLAKELGTLDLLSDGRVDFGIGAGWMESDYTTGVSTWDPPRVRVARLNESLDLLEHLLRGKPTTFSGEYYQLAEFESVPVPVQEKIPLLIGGRQKCMLSLAGRRAQIVSILARTSAAGNTQKAFEQQLSWVTESAGAKTDLVLGVRVPMGRVAHPGESASEAIASFAQSVRLDEDVVRTSPFILVGDKAFLRDKLLTLIERYGIRYLTVNEEFGWGIQDLVSELSPSDCHSQRPNDDRTGMRDR